MFFRQRTQRLGEQQVLIHHHIQVALARFAQDAFHTNDIAQIPVFGVFLHVLGGINLNAPGHVLQHLESLAIKHHAAGNSDLNVLLSQLFLAELAILRLQVGGQEITTEVIGEGITRLTQVGQFGAALGDQAIFVLRRFLGISLCLLLVGHRVTLIRSLACLLARLMLLVLIQRGPSGAPLPGITILLSGTLR